MLGIEEMCALSAYGHAAAITPNRLSEAGIPTSLTLRPDGAVAVSHVLGALPLGEGAEAVASVAVKDGAALTVTLDDGTAADYPFDAAFLGLA